MTPFVAWCARQFNWPRAFAALGIALAIGANDRPVWAAESLAYAAGVHQTSIHVQLDQAKIIKMPEHAVTLVVGNPLIADVSVQAGGTMVITGKSYGVTNLVALDSAGKVLMDDSIEVQSPGGNIVYLYRGIERETYNCTPDCQRRITLGDTTSYFVSTLGQSSTLNSQAQAAQPK